MAIFRKDAAALLAAPSTFRHTVLLVDDEPDNLAVMGAILRQHYHVLQAADGTQALDLVRAMPASEKLTLVISDQRMPQLTGVQLCEQLLLLVPQTMRIIVTGYIDVDAIVDSINRARIHHFVIKPFDRHDFELRVRRAVETYELQLELAEHVATLEHKVSERTHELEERNRQLQLAYAELEKLTMSDALTGLNNRHYLHTVIDSDVAFACREYNRDGDGGGGLVFFLIDCDHFKHVNDKYGHDVGDRVLCEIADVLRQVFRGSDRLVRWGGEEFLVVARGLSRRESAVMAERLRAAMEAMEVALSDGTRLRRTCSIGYACLPFLSEAPGAVSWQQAVKLADRALYCAKASGRNTWVGLDAGAQAADTLPEIDHNRDIPALLDAQVLRVEGRRAVDELCWT